MSPRMRFAAILAATCLLLTSVILGQSSSGTITGRVVDATGHTVPAATVTLTKTDTREVRTLQTPISGQFIFTAIQPGP